MPFSKDQKYLTVSDIMTTNVACGAPSTNAAAAAEMMWNRNCGALPVTEDGKEVVGIVTDRDLFIALGTSNRLPAEVPLRDVMRTDLCTCVPEDEVRTALKKMALRKVHRLIVVDSSGTLQGILSMDDIIRRANLDSKGLSSQDVVLALNSICEQSPLVERAGKQMPPASRSTAVA